MEEKYTPREIFMEDSTFDYVKKCHDKMVAENAGHLCSGELHETINHLLNYGMYQMNEDLDAAGMLMVEQYKRNIGLTDDNGEYCRMISDEEKEKLKMKLQQFTVGDGRNTFSIHGYGMIVKPGGGNE